MGNSHAERQNRSLVRFAKQMSAKRREVFQTQLSVSEGAESWRLALIDDLTHLNIPEEHCKWAPGVLAAIYDWDASLDIRWRENVKWFLVSSITRTRTPSPRNTKWIIPITCNSDLFSHSSLSDFLSDHLRMATSHGIAYLISYFIKFFLAEYQGEILESEDLYARMKGEILGFCQVMTGALRLYYGNIDIVGLLGNKHESFLTLILCSRLMEDERLYRLYYWSISSSRRAKELAFGAKLAKHKHASMRDLNSDSQTELADIAANSGFLESAQCLQEFTQTYSLKSKLDCILRMQEAANKEIERCRVNQSGITLMADDMVTLFCFFILKAQVKDLGSHLELLNGLVHFGQLESFSGFLLASLEGSLMYMEEEAFRT